MKLSSIRELLSGTISVLDFKAQINDELRTYKKSLLKTGASAHIYLEEDLKEILIAQADVKVVCDLFLKKEMDNWEFNYIVEALLLSPHVSFVDENTRSIVEDLADPEYGLNLSPQYVKSIIDSINFSDRGESSAN